MVRVHVLVEGPTEKTFVQSVLQPHFTQYEIYLSPRQLGKPQHKRGICEYPLARQDILATLKQETHTFCTTMFDYYGMPPDWPKREEARHKPFAEKFAMVEDAILSDIASQLGGRFDRSRLIPYVQMHEFEALLFSDPKTLAGGLELADDVPLRRIRDQFKSPEEINDSQQTAPSKRIVELKPRYGKVTDGVRISQKIGLDAIQAQCPHFNEWIGKLETLASRK
jgi:hypothetical protein